MVPWNLSKNALISKTYTGYRALHDINGIMSMVTILSFLFSMVRVAIMAGTLQPNPISMGMNDLP